MAFPPTNFCRQFKPLGLMYVITSYQNALKPKYLTFSYGDNLDNWNLHLYFKLLGLVTGLVMFAFFLQGYQQKIDFRVLCFLTL